MFRSLRLTVVFAIVLTVSLIVSPRTFAQRQVETETRTGTIKEVQSRGRSKTLVVTLSDGEELTIPLTARVNFEVKLSGGDISAVQPGAFLTGTGVLTNQQLFLDEVSVYLIERRQRVPNSQIAQPELSAGQSVNARQVSGQIVNRQTAPNYPEYQQVMLKAPPQIPPLMLKGDVRVNVFSKDPEAIQADQAVELDVIPTRSGKLTVVKLTVEGGEYQPPAEDSAEKK